MTGVGIAMAGAAEKTDCGAAYDTGTKGWGAEGAGAAAAGSSF